MMDFTAVNTTLTQAVPELCPAAQLVVRQQGGVIYERAYGWLDTPTPNDPGHAL